MMTQEIFQSLILSDTYCLIKNNKAGSPIMVIEIRRTAHSNFNSYQYAVRMVYYLLDNRIVALSDLTKGNHTFPAKIGYALASAFDKLKDKIKHKYSEEQMLLIENYFKDGFICPALNTIGEAISNSTTIITFTEKEV